MSYPRKLHTLIVEDELGPRQSYEMLFRRLRERGSGDFEGPVFALSFEDAKKRLSGSDLFHIVILDMGLPEKNRQSVPEGVEPGMQLLELAALRDNYPIPVVLVISGRLGGKTDVPQIRARLERDFWYGQFLNKGVKTEEEILEGIAKAQQYCDVGIHVRDSSGSTYPTLSPREDDLLRRCILKANFLGVDLEWWSAEDAGTEQNSGRWKKVLMGRFLMGEGRGMSSQTFFKFEATEDAGYVHAAANIATNKLRHVKMVYSCTSRTRSLLVTESVCAAPPISVDEFLVQDPEDVLPALPEIVDDIVQQLDQLGVTSETTMPVKDILWPHFQVKTIRKAADRWIKPEFRQIAEVDVVKVFEVLSMNTNSLWVHVRQCNHGDLHAKNIAIDTCTKPFRAFIFDTGAMNQAVNVRDLALLEVTSLLFQRPPRDGTSLVQACEQLYVDKIAPPSLDLTTGSPQARNTRVFISEIRQRASKLCEPEVYALSVFDHALMEFSGLAVQSNRNKIWEPFDAARLVVMAAEWLSRIAPDLLSP